MSSTSLSISLPASASVESLLQGGGHSKAKQAVHRIDIGVAAIRIQRLWRCHRNKQIFRLLKHATQAAENCATYEILKKVSPLEAELLKDPGMQCKVRFRFAGYEFPPFIVFKIFHSSGGHGNRFITGKRIIIPSSEAASDACKLMGHRTYYGQMICDQLEHQKYRITDVVDVATFKDYMQSCGGNLQCLLPGDEHLTWSCNKTGALFFTLPSSDNCIVACTRGIIIGPGQYISHLDETPAHRGGRDNCWRRLSLRNMPRTTLMYDIVDYAESGTLSSRLKEEMKLLLQMPHSVAVQRRQLSAVTQLRSPQPPPSSAISTYLSSIYSAAPRNSSRRSQKARLKVAKMKRIYGPGKEEQEQYDTRVVNQQLFSGQQEQANHVMFSDDDWDEEAEKLYAWSQNLSLEESAVPCPVHL